MKISLLALILACLCQASYAGYNNGDYNMPDGTGGYFMSNGDHNMSDGTGGYFMSNGDHQLSRGGMNARTPDGDYLYEYE